MDHGHAMLTDAFTRVTDDLPTHLSGLGADELLWQPDPQANSIAWLVWHLARVQDDHMAAIGGVEQIWTSQGWEQRFGLPYQISDIGYGQQPDDIAAFDVTDPDLLLGYQRAAHRLSVTVLAELDDSDLATVIDRRWDPAVTVAVRVVSVINDITQHVGQVGYLRGLVSRREIASS
jgi:uncharacterized damage-inducible protein DinB